jgi:hypothetical protein
MTTDMNDTTTALDLLGSDGLVYRLAPAPDCYHNAPRRKVTLKGIDPGIRGKLDTEVCTACGAVVSPELSPPGVRMTG